MREITVQVSDDNETMIRHLVVTERGLPQIKLNLTASAQNPVWHPAHFALVLHDAIMYARVMR